jgi:hypothetical protein
MRSLTEEQGCMLSSLASTVAGAPSVTLLSLSSGVLPVRAWREAAVGA